MVLGFIDVGSIDGFDIIRGNFLVSYSITIEAGSPLRKVAVRLLLVRLLLVHNYGNCGRS
jgi:hypothetical protein